MILVLDTVTLINLTTRTKLPPLLDLLVKNGETI